jgi:hypothetical protein
MQAVCNKKGTPSLFDFWWSWPFHSCSVQFSHVFVFTTNLKIFIYLFIFIFFLISCPPLLPLNSDRCTRDRRHACAPVLSGFCPAPCRLTTRTTRPAKRFCSKTVIVNPLLFGLQQQLSYGIRNETKNPTKERSGSTIGRKQQNTAPLHTYKHTRNILKGKKEQNFTKQIILNTDWSRQRKQMSFFTSSLFFS